MLAAVYWALALGGCAPRTVAEASTTARKVYSFSHIRAVSKQLIYLPERSLLQPQPEPDCAFKGSLSNPATAEEMRMKLDYEQQCYRQAEAIVRTRLQQLQNSLDK